MSHALPPHLEKKTLEPGPKSAPRFDNVRVIIDHENGRVDELRIDQMKIRYEPTNRTDGSKVTLMHFGGEVRSAKMHTGSRGVEVRGREQAPESEAKLHPMAELQKEYSNCRLCRLGQEGTCNRTQVVFSDGNYNNPKILILGEAPGPDEDEQGKPFVGRVGTMLRRELQQVGIQVDRDCFITNSVLCLPWSFENKKWRAPLGDEVLACRDRLQQQLKLIGRDLKVVLLLGKRAVATFLMPQLLKGGELDDLKGWDKHIKMKEHLGWHAGVLPWGDSPKVYSTWHPSYVARQSKSRAGALSTEWRLDLKAVADFALRGQFTDPRVMK